MFLDVPTTLVCFSNSRNVTKILMLALAKTKRDIGESSDRMTYIKVRTHRYGSFIEPVTLVSRHNVDENGSTVCSSVERA